jgi:site-specific recombinase XerD
LASLGPRTGLDLLPSRGLRESTRLLGLTKQRAMSPRTVATYRDGFVLFLDCAVAHLHKQPTTMRLQDITPALILAFLDHLERDRGNAVRTRNARLAALRAFLKFAGHRDVEALHVVEQALGVPMKRFERPMLGFLSREEMLAIIGKPEGLLDQPARPPAAAHALQHRCAGVGDHRRTPGGCRA